MKKKKPKKSAKPKKKAKAKVKKPTKVAKKKPAKKKAATGKRDLMAEFQQALELVMGGYLFDAVQAFDGVVKANPRGDLADDALMNQGLCYLHMKLFHDAVASFTRVIQGYPKATILEVPGAHEHGRTAAKALLGRIRCHLALGDSDAAKSDLESLLAYEDSYVIDNEGTKRTFHDLGRESVEVSQSVT